jgi:alpha-tubulin suppressor-like RCC1 family protein
MTHHRSVARMALGAAVALAIAAVSPSADATSSRDHGAIAGPKSAAWTARQVIGIDGVVRVSVGWSYEGFPSPDGPSYGIHADGSVVAWGGGRDGQLGDGTFRLESRVGVPVLKLRAVKSLVSNSFSSFALTADGTVWSWGSGYYGALGRKSVHPRHAAVPGRVRGLPAIRSLWLDRGDTTYAIDRQGRVWAWGRGTSGELGNGSLKDSRRPVRVRGLTHVIKVVGHVTHQFAIKADGTVWSWGDNYRGALGRGHRASPVLTTPARVEIPARVSSVATFADRAAWAITDSGRVWTWGARGGFLGVRTGKDLYQPRAIPGLRHVESITGRGNTFDHTSMQRIARTTDGRVLTWGSYPYPGDGSESGSRVPVTVDVPHTSWIFAGPFVRATGGATWIWGVNSQGEVGDGTTVARPTPVHIQQLSHLTSMSSQWPIAVDAAGGLWWWGDDFHGDVVVPTRVEAVPPMRRLISPTHVANTDWSVLARDGTVWSMSQPL